MKLTISLSLPQVKLSAMISSSYRLILYSVNLPALIALKFHVTMYGPVEVTIVFSSPSPTLNLAGVKLTPPVMYAACSGLSARGWTCGLSPAGIAASTEGKKKEKNQH